ncbi:MAG: hypothetical protein ACAI35_22500 [Candidatus Methylacidiphilales bacterium]
MTLLVISFLVMARMERTVSNLAMDRVQAELLADLAADSAVERLREAIDEGRTFGVSQFTTWASEPGRIHVFTVAQGSGAISRKSYDMFSALPGPDDATTPNLNNIDLNEASLSGVHPVTGKIPGTMKVGWKNILANPGEPASASNTVVGRVAYWVDDESCKVNINTADGSHKNDSPATQDANKKYSYGFGVPSEISLESFSGVNPAMADSIATYAATNNFNSISEIGQVPGVPADFVSNNRFSITYTNRSPDLNMWGEPRIHLFPVNRLAAAPNRTVNFMLGPYGGNWNLGGTNFHPSNGSGGGSDKTKLNTSGNVVDHVYPTSLQLPTTVHFVAPNTVPQPLPQFLLTTDGASSTSSVNYPLALRIAKYMQGFNSQGQAITWPKFTGATANGFVDKYSLRQIDSIVLQLMDVLGKCTMCDQFRVYSSPSYMFKGYLSGEMVYGAARSLKLTELFFIFTGVAGSTPQFKFENRYEYYFPKFYEGAPLDFYAGAVGQWRIGFTATNKSIFNRHDSPGSELGPLTQWQTNLLRFEDGGGNTAGIDLWGWPKQMNTVVQDPTFPTDPTKTITVLKPYPDPDQTSAQLYHPYTYDATENKYTGSNGATNDIRPLFTGGGPWGGAATLRGPPGLYQFARAFNDHITRTTRPGLASVSVKGGISFTTHNESGAGPWEIAPMEALRGSDYSGESEASIKQIILDNVIPVETSLSIPGKRELSVRVADPLVNKFPGDWILEEDPSATNKTWRPPNTGNGDVRPYMRDATTIISTLNTEFPRKLTTMEDPINLDGDNPEFRPANGGDPLSLWLPRQDLRVPKQSRFPSVGALNTLRTGMIPDTFFPTNPRKNKGVPFRCLCFDASTGPGQSTPKGSYPDWALLDLFTVPFLPQAPVTIETNPDIPYPNPPAFRQLTSGGSTEGRLNINNPRVPYPFGESISGVVQNGPERLAPLQALFKNVQVSRSYAANSDPIYETVDAVVLGNAVQSYLATNGPFMLAGQLANVPEVADFTYRGVTSNAQSRNDLLTKVVGATTTQSNTYSIWVVTQTIKKAAQNTNYGVVEPGDVVTGEVRRRYLVERLIEAGKDGVPGNIKKNALTSSTTNDGILNTADDLIYDDYHPQMTYPLPYRWRILSVEDVVR